MARSDAANVLLDDGQAALEARLAQALEDLVGAVRVGIEPAHDLALECIELAGARHTRTRSELLHGGPLGHRARIQCERPRGLSHGKLLAAQGVADLAEGLIVEHGGAPAVRAVGPGSPGRRCRLLVPARSVSRAAPPWSRELPAPGTAAPGRR